MTNEALTTEEIIAIQAQATRRGSARRTRLERLDRIHAAAPAVAPAIVAAHQATPIVIVSARQV